MPESPARTPRFVRATPRGPYRIAELFAAPPVYGCAPSRIAWSRNGQHFAFLWNEEGGFRQDVWVCGLEGPPLRVSASAAIPPHPVEGDKREKADIEHAERIAPGVTELVWSDPGDGLFYLCGGDLYSVAPDGASDRCLIGGGAGISYLTAIPESPAVSFVMRGDLWSFDPTASALRKLTYFGNGDVTPTWYTWAPDGGRVAVVMEDRSSWETVRMPDYMPRDGVKINELRRNNVGKPLAKVRVGVVPRGGGLAEVLPLELPGEGPTAGKTGLPISLQGLRWSWDSRALVAAYTCEWYRDFRIAAASPGQDGPARVLHDETALPWFPHTRVAFDPESRWVYFLAPRDNRSQLCRVSLEGGRCEQITRAERDVVGFDLPRESPSILYGAYHPDPRDLAVRRCSLDGDGDTAIASSHGAAALTVSDDGLRGALLRSSVMSPPELLRLPDLSRPSDCERVVDSATERFAAVPKPRLERFSFPFSHAGRTDELLGRLILPASFDPDKRYPAVLSCVYAGQGKDGFGRYQVLDTWMANEMGYICVGLDLRASPGYGHDFLTGYYKSLGIIDTEECVRCAEHLRTLPYVDTERVGIWGGSYGGFLVLMAMCNHPGVFHTGISWKPVTDWRNYWDGYTAPRLTRPDDDPKAYEATSPVFHAEGLEGNLLIVHGMQDDNVLFQDAVWMIQKLIEAGRYFDLMIYPRDDHGLTLREESLPDAMERTAAYFEEHMGLGPV